MTRHASAIPPGRLFASVPEYVEMTGYDRKTIILGIQRGEIPHIKHGRTFRIPMLWIREQARLDAEGSPGAA